MKWIMRNSTILKELEKLKESYLINSIILIIYTILGIVTFFMEKLVSIGLPTFNRSKSLKRALDSLLAQTYTNLELIISDNASTDSTESICRKYARKDKRIKYFRQKKNIGMLRQIDFLVKKRAGDYFMLVSDDDWWHPDFILKLKKALDEHPECGIAMGSLRQVYDDGVFINEIVYDKSNDLSKFSYSQTFDAVVTKKPPAHFFIYGLFREEIINKIFLLPYPTVIGPDKVLMYEASLFTHLYSVPEVLMERTIHRGRDSNRYSEDFRDIVLDRGAYTKHIWATISRLVRSSNIPVSRKIFLLPPKISILIWSEKKHLFHEIFPFGFRWTKKILRRKAKING